MKVEINSKKNATADIVIYMIMAIVIAVILIPMIVLRENYYFTVHDYLDSWPSLFKVLRRGGIFFNPDGQMPMFNSHPRFPFCKRVSHFESDLQILYPTFHFCNDFPVFSLAFMI